MTSDNSLRVLLRGRGTAGAITFSRAQAPPLTFRIFGPWTRTRRTCDDRRTILRCHDRPYELHPLDDGRATRLVLRSEHRTSTRFNFYAGWWADRVMTSTEDNIRAVHKARAARLLPGARGT